MGLSKYFDMAFELFGISVCIFGSIFFISLSIVILFGLFSHKDEKETKESKSIGESK